MDELQANCCILKTELVLYDGNVGMSNFVQEAITEDALSYVSKLIKVVFVFCILQTPQHKFHCYLMLWTAPQQHLYRTSKP